MIYVENDALYIMLKMIEHQLLHYVEPILQKYLYKLIIFIINLSKIHDT